MSVGEDVCLEKVAELVLYAGLRNTPMRQNGEPATGPKQNENQGGRQWSLQPHDHQNSPFKYQSITRGAKKSSEVKMKPILGTNAIRFPRSKARMTARATRRVLRAFRLDWMESGGSVF
jgi:hypothetical protein